MRNQILAGVISLCVGVLVFSLQDALIKAVSDRYPITEVMAVRAVIALPILLVMVHFEAGVGAIVSRVAGFLTLRATILFVSYTTYYLAIAALPLAEAVALFFTAPLLITAMAHSYLGERVSMQVFVGLAVGLAGVLVMLQPGLRLFEWAAVLSLFSAGLYGFAQLMARKVGSTESASVMSFYQNGIYLVGSLVLAGTAAAADFQNVGHPSLAFLTRPWAWPTFPDFMMMAACGAVASAGMILLSQAYRLAPANRIATFEYTGILWAPLWGFMFFAEIPHVTTIIGAALIVGAGLISLNVNGLARNAV